VDTAQSKFGGGSLLLDGNSDYVAGDGSSDFAFGTGDFVIDFWLRLAAVGLCFLMDFGPVGGGSGGEPVLLIDTSGKLRLDVQGVSSNVIGSTVLTTGVWNHIAFLRKGTTSRYMLNGVSDGTLSDSNNYPVAAGAPAIGDANGGTSIGCNGWMEEIRITKGITRGMESTFSVPTSPYDVDPPLAIPGPIISRRLPRMISSGLR
jgi:hypothetical protein